MLWCLLVFALGQNLAPEAVVRALVTAIYKGDIVAYNAVTLPDPRRSVLTANARVNEEKLRELTEHPQGLQIKISRPYLYKGNPAKPDRSGAYPVGTTVLFMAAHSGGPMMVPLVRKPEGWRVDVMGRETCRPRHHLSRRAALPRAFGRPRGVGHGNAARQNWSWRVLPDAIRPCDRGHERRRRPGTGGNVRSDRNSVRRPSRRNRVDRRSGTVFRPVVEINLAHANFD
jgi:hypothetical protein